MRRTTLQKLCTIALGVLFVVICFATQNHPQYVISGNQVQICAYMSSWVLLISAMVFMSNEMLLFNLPLISIITYFYLKLFIKLLVKKKWIAYSALAVHSAGGFILAYGFSEATLTVSSVLILVVFLAFAISLRTSLLRLENAMGQGNAKGGT